MSEPVLQFDTRQDCGTQFRACLARASATLEAFDPDFSVFPLGELAADTALRAFLARGGTLRLAMHSARHIERHYPRFLRLLRDYAHAAECRVTSRGLYLLTDSFCIADGVHIVRRFHSDHMRGMAAFDSPDSADIARERFAAIWAESRPALQPTPTGL